MTVHVFTFKNKPEAPATSFHRLALRLNKGERLSAPVAQYRIGGTLTTIGRLLRRLVELGMAKRVKDSCPRVYEGTHKLKRLKDVTKIHRK